MKITKPGVYPDLDEAIYHADPVPESSLSVSGAKKLLDCPARFKWDRENPRTSKAFDFGKAAHCKVLGVGSPVVPIPVEFLAKNGAASTTAAKDFIAAAEKAGQVPLKPDEVAVIDAMAAQLLAHPIASALLRDGSAEQSMFWRDPDTKVMLRGRLDWLTTLRSGRACIVDYKTTAGTANPSRWRYDARDFGYHQQDAWYREGAEAVGIGADPAFLFIVQEKTAPYLVSVVELDDESREDGAVLNTAARRLYLDCMTRDDWPGYPPVVHPITVPRSRFTTEGTQA